MDLLGVPGKDDSRYPQAVEKALSSCLPSDDPLDREDFDPVAFVNEKFPDESSFARLDSFLGELRSQVVELDASIFDAVKLQSTKAWKASTEIEEAKTSIKQLENKIHDIKGKAQQSEVMVEEICRDIKKLDNAKRHLTYTITSLKRFHMLVTAVDQLDFMVENRQYQETANLLQAVSQLFIHFENHTDVKSIQKLRDSVAKTRTMLTEQIFRDFEALSEVSADYSLMTAEKREERPQSFTLQATPDTKSSLFLSNEDQYNPGHHQQVHDYDDPNGGSASMFYSSDSHTPESLAGACAVVDALGSSVRRKLIEKICHIWLQPYDLLFGPGKEHGGLDSTERRYAWVRRLFRDNDDRYESIFPQEWCINRHVLALFIKKTEDHLKAELRKIDPPDSADVSALVRSLRKTLDFEQEMYVKFDAKRKASMDSDSGSKDTKEEEEGEEEDVIFDANGDRVDPMSAKGIRLRRERQQQQEQQGAVPGQEKALDIDASKAAKSTLQDAKKDVKALGKIKGRISGVFEPYLMAYVKLEADKMREELETVIQQETSGLEDAHNLTSASNMFLLIQKSINRCIQFSTGQAFYDLYSEFKKVMNWYAARLDKRLPPPGKPLTPESLLVACFVCNSAEYCVDTVPQLQELIEAKINEAYQDTIDMDDVVDRFSGNLQTALQALVGGIHAIIDKHLAELSKINWSTFQQVGDQSKYVSTLSTALREMAPLIRKQLTSVVYFRTFCSMFANSFIERFKDMLLRCKKVNELGAQQLLLDAQGVKTLLLQLPTMGVNAEDEADQDAPFTVYRKHVSNSMQKVEAQLKLVSMNLPASTLVETFKTLLAEGDTEDLRIILEMKGLKKQDQASALKQAEDAGIPKGKPRPPVSASQPQANSYLSSISEAAGAAGLTGSVPSAAAAASGASSSFSTVFSKMSDMKETFDKVANTSGAKGLSSLSATFQQSYNRAVNKSNQEK